MDRLYIVRMTAMIASDTSVICVLLKIKTHATLKNIKRTLNDEISQSFCFLVSCVNIFLFEKICDICQIYECLCYFPGHFINVSIKTLFSLCLMGLEINQWLLFTLTQCRDCHFCLN